MAYTKGLCEKLQVNINDVAGTNAPALNRQKVGYIDALMSQVNRSQMTAQMVPTNGKFKQVQVNWIAQACDADVNTDCVADCTADVTPEPNETIISEFNCAKYKMSFDENEMRKLCEADNVWVSQNIMKSMNAINMSVDKAVLALASTNIGDNASGSALTQIPLYTTSGSPNPLAWAQIRHYMDELGANGTPLIVGGSSLDIYAKAQQIACCNTEFGMDLSRMSSDGMFFHDINVNSVFSPTQFLAFAPGAVQMITWNKYAGEYAKQNDSFTHGTIVDPFTGLVYDLKTSYDDCTEKWFVELALNWALFFIPKTSLCVNADSNLTLLFEDCSAGAVQCP